MAEAFISYRHTDPDQQLARELAAALAASGVSHFVDTQIRIGQQWVEVIDRELRAANALIVLLSADSIRSHMVRHEVTLAHRLRKPIFPIRVAYDGALPYDLGAYLDGIQYMIWSPGDPFAPICAAILDQLRAGPQPQADPVEPGPQELRTLKEVTEHRGAPLPCADPRLETGAVKLDSPFYIRRNADDRVDLLVQQPGETILIKGPRQVGKTSLAARACAAAQRNGQRTCFIDLQLVDDSRLRDFSTLLQYLAARIAREFQTKIKPQDVWDSMLGDADSFTEFLEAAVLAHAAKGAVVLCLDEVDNVFEHSYRDNFFGMLRGWHNRRATRLPWNAFNLVLSHSTEPALFIRDLNQSPFNVGVPIRLGDFTLDEVRDLNARHGSPLASGRDLERLLEFVGGHPYLVRQALFTLASQRIGLDELERSGADDTGPFGDHLRRLLWSLRDNAALASSLRGCLKSKGCGDEDAFQRLRAAGLVDGADRQSARLCCRLYETYLEAHL